MSDKARARTFLERTTGGEQKQWNAPLSVQRMVKVVVTAVDTSSSPPKHTVAGIDRDGNATTLVIAEVETADEVALAVGAKAVAMQMPDSSWTMATGGGVSFGIEDHGHTGPGDGGTIGILA